MKQRAWMFYLLPLLTLVIATVAFVRPWGSRPPSSAHAASTGNSLMGLMKPYGSHNSSTVANGNLTYHGGPVMDGTAHVFLIFWEPVGFGVTPRYNSLMTRWFKDVGRFPADTPLYENNEQYTSTDDKAPEHVVVAGTFLDTQPYPANPMTDAQVQAEVTHAQTVNGWTSSIHNIFFVYTGSGEHNAAADGIACAYHSFFGTNTIYAAMIYPTVLAGCLAPLPSPNNDQVADSEINLSSHDQMEAATDPILPTGWFHVDISHEIGDECNFVFGPRNSLGGDVKYFSHPYLVQKEWDNAKSGCTLQGP
jgi:hypothetical protein